MHKTIRTICFFCFIWLTAGLPDTHCFDIPHDPPSNRYGNLLISRLSDQYGKPWVTFSHWSHRLRYTCRVCHFELGFEMQVNATEITEEKNKNGELCGACHNGSIAFGHTEDNCSKCHNGNVVFGEDKFKELASLPEARFGNRVDWTKALKKRLIKPVQSILNDDYAPMPFKGVLMMRAETANISPAVFPHKIHNQWLDCANCHPDIFNIKRKTTEHFQMKYILQGKFCGVCHLKVAFPINDCMRCHPAGKQ